MTRNARWDASKLEITHYEVPSGRGSSNFAWGPEPMYHKNITELNAEGGAGKRGRSALGVWEILQFLKVEDRKKSQQPSRV